MNYYNEFDPNAAAWLRGLIDENLIPPGEVDERSITDVTPNDLFGFIQCHFFCGIAGWPLAFKLAGWPADRKVWSGSCPCQPFSAAGKGLGTADERHLWPAFFNLIRQCRPDIVFGEQVADAIGKGWLDGVSADLEGEGYACGAVVLGAHSVGADHIRQRLYWVADTGGWMANTQNTERRADRNRGADDDRQARGRDESSDRLGEYREAGGMAHRVSTGLEGHAGDGNDWCEPGWFGADAAGSAAEGGADGGVVHSDSNGCEPGSAAPEAAGHGYPPDAADCWADSIWIPCRDGKHRRISAEPALFPLSDGLPYKLARRGSVRAPLLKGAGNAIVPQVAAEFISSWLDVSEDFAVQWRDHLETQYLVS